MRTSVVAAFVLCMVAVGAGNDGDDTGLLTILDKLQGGSYISKLMSFLKEFNAAREFIKEWISGSPMSKTLVEEAAKNNIKLAVMLKIVKGQMPDLHDLYKFATTKTDSLTFDIQSVLNNSAEWLTVKALMTNKTTLQSAAKTEQLVKMFTGINMKIKPSLLRRVGSGQLTLTPADDVIQADALEIISFLLDNAMIVRSTLLSFGDSSIDYRTTLKQLLSMDYSHLMKVVVPPTKTGDKYSFSSTKARQDPDVVHLKKILLSARSLTASDQKADSKANGYVMDILQSIFSLVNKAAGWLTLDKN